MLSMNSLVIGSTSQLAYYFPIEYTRVSSRNINLGEIRQSYWDRIFLCFGEQRTFIENNEEEFIRTNLDYTIKVIDALHKHCQKLIVYSTSELWNQGEGPIDLSNPFSYNYSPYIRSKELLTKAIEERRSVGHLKNVIIVYPFNFNSIYRTYQFIDGKFTIRHEQKFLFSKIFESILSHKKIEIGDTYFYRDIIHPKYVMERSILTENDEIVGSGRLIHVNDFIRDLYKNSGLKYEDYVIENFDHNLKVKRRMYYLNSREAKYTKLLIDTLNDIRSFQNQTGK